MNLAEDVTLYDDDPAPASSDEAETRAKLWELIRDIRFAMFTTRHDDERLYSRPLTTQNSRIDEDASLWFFMSRRADPALDLTRDPGVNIVYADPGKDRYVSITGTAAIVESRAKKAQLWSKLAEAWFPRGVEDPDLALVQVRIIHASYWDVRENKLVQLYKMAKAAFTGIPPTDLGEHAEIRMG